ncbi:MAG TPA: MAPEG family protein [Steroidobacteraceae bacterium]|nr:MAPEG family protein [Steroidobacteraceae bacterium]
MTPDRAILLPCLALAALAFVVLGRTGYVRISELRRRRIHPQKIASSKALAELEDTRAADHLRNLFEMPVLFYVLCVLLSITKLTTPFLLACAWGYVFLRGVQASIHLTHNTVVRRFQVFVAGSFVLFVMWIVFAVRLLSAP